MSLLEALEEDSEASLDRSTAVIDDDLRERLQALGYLLEDPSPLPSGNLRGGAVGMWLRAGPPSGAGSFEAEAE